MWSCFSPFIAFLTILLLLMLLPFLTVSRSAPQFILTRQLQHIQEIALTCCSLQSSLSRYLSDQFSGTLPWALPSRFLLLLPYGYTCVPVLGLHIIVCSWTSFGETMLFIMILLALQSMIKTYGIVQEKRYSEDRFQEI